MEFLKWYVKGAVNTESRDFPAIGHRLSNPMTFSLFAQLLSELILLGQRMDSLKKHTFYGKELNAVISHQGDFSPEMVDKATVPHVLRLLHGMMGMLTEAGEIAEHLKGVIFNGEELDPINLMEEQGDNMWYNAIFADTINDIAGVDFVECLKRNHDKLAARYPEKFKNEDALNRDLEKERGILEGDKSDNAS